jgi:NAD(P)-dependent dehydrogenase (short-subunit alcohol dehydrogenase family)
VSFARRLQGAHTRLSAQPWWTSSPPNHVVLLTGGSQGIGFAVAVRLASEGAHVVLTAPDDTALVQAVQNVRAKAARAGGATVRVTGLLLDQGTTAGVAAFCTALQRAVATHGWHIRGLVCNAAVLAVAAPPPGHAHPCFAVNLLGTWRLLRRLHAARLVHASTGQCRIVVVSSFTHRCERVAHLLAWLQAPLATAQPRSTRAYALSKAGVSCAAARFAQLHCTASDGGGQQPGLSLWLADPGLVDTQLTQEWPAPLRRASRLLGFGMGLMRPPEEGAAAVVAALGGVDGDGRGHRGTHPPYVFGAHGVRLRPGAAGGGDPAVAALVEELMLKADAIII